MHTVRRILFPRYCWVKKPLRIACKAACMVFFPCNQSMWWGSRRHFRPRDRASTRAHRRITTPEDVNDLAPIPLGPRATTWHARKISTRNKYLLLEQRANEQGYKNQIEATKLCQDREENGNLPTNLQQWGTEPSQSYYTFTNSFSTGRLRLRMKRVDRINSGVGSSLKRGEGKFHLAERAFIPTIEVFNALEALSGTLIFNAANKEERLALASRLRHWVVEDGTYLIREGDSNNTSETAIFMVASGKATISLNRTLEDGSVEEADVKDIKYPSYFGEGRVLGDSRAYASVRAKEELVVYYIMKEDFVELISPATRALMVRDMQIRKYQKKHVDDLFGIIRKNPSGMACLARFAKEKLMGGEVAFTIDVEAYKSFGGDKCERKEMAQRIFETYISSAGGPQVIYTSEPQRKALAAAMERLWGKAPRCYEVVTLSEPAISPRDGELENHRRAGQTTSVTEDLQSFAAKGFDDGEQGGGNDWGEYKRAIEGSPSKTDGDFFQIVRNSAGEGHLGVDVVEGGGRTPGNLFGEKIKAGKPENSTQDDSSWNHSDCCSIQSGDDDADDLRDADAAHSQTLFDAILNQNAIPTMRQNIVPKFIQSGYYEAFLTELFPYEAEPSASNGHPSRSKVDFHHDQERVLSETLEAARDHPEAAAKTIAAAVAVAAKAARSGEKDGRGSVTEDKIKVNAGDPRRSPVDEGETACGRECEVLPCISKNGLDDEPFSDELLVGANIQQDSIMSRVSKAGFAARMTASEACSIV